MLLRNLIRTSAVRRCVHVAAATTATNNPVAAVTTRLLSTTPTNAQDQQDATMDQALVAPEKGWFGRMMDRMSIRGQQKRILLGEELFQAATRQAKDPRWYGPGRIPRDFRSRHAMLTMHLWFLNKRLLSSANSNGVLTRDQCLLIQEELFDIFWNDTLCRIRAEGVYEMSVNKHLDKVQQYTFLHLGHYDHIFHALASSQSHLDAMKDEQQQEQPIMDPDQKMDLPDGGSVNLVDIMDPSVDLTKVDNRISELKKLIWMHIMVRDPEAKECDDHLTRLAWYIEAQYQNILVDWPGQYVQEARVGWVDLPDFSNLQRNNGQPMEERPVHPEDVLPQPWLTNITLRGETYYWNPETFQSQWERPDQGTAAAAAAAAREGEKVA